ncbi:hypothetical protein BGZ73_008964, partial [Actinomortierella ambigua]
PKRKGGGASQGQGSQKEGQDTMPSQSGDADRRTDDREKDKSFSLVPEPQEKVPLESVGHGDGDVSMTAVELREPVESLEVSRTTLVEDHDRRVAAAGEERSSILPATLTVLKDGPDDQSREKADPKDGDNEDTWDGMADDEWGDIAKEMGADPGMMTCMDLNEGKDVSLEPIWLWDSSVAFKPIPAGVYPEPLKTMVLGIDPGVKVSAHVTKLCSAW